MFFLSLAAVYYKF